MKLAILDDQVTPYRIPLFERIADRVGDMLILYCSLRLKERRWRSPETLSFPHEFLPHIAIRLRRPPYNDPRTILLNPTLFARLVVWSPDVVVGYAFSVPALTAFLYAKLFGKRYVSWSTGTLHTERFLGPGQRLLRSIIIPRANACLTPSMQGKEKYLFYGVSGDKVKVAVQSADVDWFSRRSQAARDEGAIFVDRRGIDGRCLVYVGFLSERKGVTLLLDAFASVKARLPDAKLILAGDGPQRNHLEKLARHAGLEGDVHFAGFVPQNELPAIYASGDLFVLPTLEDTFGVVLSEAAACSLPIVSSTFAGASSEYVEEGINGHIIDPRNTSEMVDAIINVLQDEEKRKRMAKASLAIAQKNGLDKEVEGFMAAVGLALRGD